MENWRRRKQRSGNEGRGSNGGRIGKFENMKKDDERRGEGRERKGKKEDAKGQSGRRVLKDESRRKREHPPSGSRVFVCVCVSLCVYIYIYKVSKRMLPWKEVGELSKNDCTFRGSARSRGISDGRSRFHGYIRVTP